MKVWKWLKRFILRFLVGLAGAGAGYGIYKLIMLVISKWDIIKKYGLYVVWGILIIAGLEVLGGILLFIFKKIKSKIWQDNSEDEFYEIYAKNQSHNDGQYCDEPQYYSEEQQYDGCDEPQSYTETQYFDELYEQTEG